MYVVVGCVAPLTSVMPACSTGAQHRFVRTQGAGVRRGSRALPALATGHAINPQYEYRMQIQRFTFNPFQTNCFVCSSDGEAVVIDPSCITPDEIATVEAYLDQSGLLVRHLLLTHGHIDHIFGCAHFAKKYEMSFKMHREDAPLLANAEEQAKMFGVSIDPPPATSSFLVEGDVVEFGKVQCDVLHTPGHSPGSICFYDAASRAAISGDVLFQGSIGRTDLWRGSLPELMRSIFGKVITLGDEVRIYPGHGPDTTVARERTSNPFLTKGIAE